MTAFNRIDRRLTVLMWMVGLQLGLTAVLWGASLGLLIHINALLSAIHAHLP
jgi:hypothetical protein